MVKVGSLDIVPKKLKAKEQMLFAKSTFEHGGFGKQIVLQAMALESSTRCSI